MSTQKSTSFGKLKRPAGKEFRSGTLGEAIDDLYGDVDDAFEALELGTPYAPVKLATIAVLSPANTYSVVDGKGTLTATGVGTLTVDGVLTVLNDRILVKNEAADLENGLYYVSTAGAGGAAYVLTRVIEMDETDDVTLSRTVMVTHGGTLLNSTFRISTWVDATDVLGTNDMNWTQVGVGTLAAGALSADAGGRALMATDYLNAAHADTAIALGALGEDLLTADEVDARSIRPIVSHAAGVADMSASAANRPGMLVAYDFVIANAAAGTLSWDNIPFDMKIVGITIRKNGVVSGGDTVGITTDVDGATGHVALFTAINMGAAAGAVSTQVLGWSETQATLVAGADIDIVTAGVAGNRGFGLTLMCIRT